MEKLFGATNGEDMYHDIMYIYIYVGLMIL